MNVDLTKEEKQNILEDLIKSNNHDKLLFSHGTFTLFHC